MKDFNIKSTSSASMKEKLSQKINTRTKPLGSLGVLEKLALQIGLIQNTLNPTINKHTMLIFAGDHGLADEGVSAFPKEVTAQMVFNFLNGGAAINVFAKQNGWDLKIIDAGVDYDFENIPNLINKKIGNGTKSILRESAMTSEECQKAIDAGAELAKAEFDAGSNTIAFGEMGIANTSSASLIMSRILDLPIENCTGRGTGLNDEKLNYKIDILTKALNKHPEINAPLDILRTFGGFEIAMTVGAALKAAELGMLIIVDGFIISSAILLASEINKTILDYCVFAHLSDEFAHASMLEYLGAQPLLNLNMRLGEGSGAAVALPIIQSAVNFLTQMASFEDAAVTEGNK
jgi:nicotinate-nucleotide--dimethylbenzimidazole phosphoribosyltransferase